MNASFNLNFRPLISKLRSNLTIIFWVALVLLLLLEVRILKKSYDKLNIAREEVQITVSRQVRINDEAYNAAIKRVENSSGFQPQSDLETTPFGIINLSQ